MPHSNVRWHVVAGISCTLFGVFMTLMGLMQVGVMAYYNITRGPIEYSYGEYEALDQIALTWQNVLRSSSVLLAGILVSFAAFSWFKQRKTAGMIFMFASFIFCGIIAALAQP